MSLASLRLHSAKLSEGGLDVRFISNFSLSAFSVSVFNTALSSSDSSFNQKMSRLAVAAATSTAGGTETLRVVREANEGEMMGTSYFCIHPSEFTLALSSRLLISPKDSAK